MLYIPLVPCVFIVLVVVPVLFSQKQSKSKARNSKAGVSKERASKRASKSKARAKQQQGKSRARAKQE